MCVRVWYVNNTIVSDAYCIMFSVSHVFWVKQLYKGYLFTFLVIFCLLYQSESLKMQILIQ